MVGTTEISVDWRPLGLLLREQGLVNQGEVVEALAYQERSGGRLGEILLGWGIVSRPLLARVLAEQRGVWLEEETGFGTGLRAAIERRHRERSSVRLGVSAMPVGAARPGGLQDV
jgi:hypothetical protein